MFNGIKNHPFAVEATFDASLVFTFAIPKEQVRPLVPIHLQLDTFQDKFAFIAIAMVQTRNLRPKGFPVFFGKDFFLIGYRVFVRFTNDKGKNLRGLYILKSETNNRQMESLGNIFTHYSYTTTDITFKQVDDQLSVISEQSQFSVHANQTAGKIPLPYGSPFSDWKEARRFAGPLPFTFTWLPAQRVMLIIEGVRTNWVPQPLHVVNYHFSFLDDFKFSRINLANAFIIRNVPYSWKKGKLEKCA